MNGSFTIGLRSDNRPLQLPMSLGFHQLVGGDTGSGKSSLLQAQLYALAGSRLVAFCGIDPKWVELAQWEPRFTVSAYDMGSVDRLASNLVGLVEHRKAYLTRVGRRLWVPEIDGPMVVVFVDEMAELGGMDAATLISALNDGDARARKEAVQGAKTAMQFRIAMFSSIARMARFVGVFLVCATQYPTAEVIDQQIRTQLTVKFMLRVSRPEQIRVILGGGETAAVSVGSIPKTEPGGFWMVDLPGDPSPVRGRAAWITDQLISQRVAATQHLRVAPEVLFPWIATEAAA